MSISDSFRKFMLQNEWNLPPIKTDCRCPRSSLCKHGCSLTVAYQVIQSPHEGFKLMLPDAALMQGSEGGASPADGAGRIGFMDGAVQQYQVLFPTGATQSGHLTKTSTHSFNSAKNSQCEAALFQPASHTHTHAHAHTHILFTLAWQLLFSIAVSEWVCMWATWIWQAAWMW